MSPTSNMQPPRSGPVQIGMFESRGDAVLDVGVGDPVAALGADGGGPWRGRIAAARRSGQQQREGGQQSGQRTFDGGHGRL
jgi:hypothetical protein